MFCKNCGKQLSDDSVFCNYCGVKQTDLGSSNNRPITVNVYYHCYHNFGVYSFDKATIEELYEEIRRFSSQLAEEYIVIEESESKYVLHPVSLGAFSPRKVKQDAEKIFPVVEKYFYDKGFSEKTIPHVSGNSDNIRTTYTYVFEKR